MEAGLCQSKLDNRRADDSADVVVLTPGGFDVPAELL